MLPAGPRGSAGTADHQPSTGSGAMQAGHSGTMRPPAPDGRLVVARAEESPQSAMPPTGARSRLAPALMARHAWRCATLRRRDGGGIIVACTCGGTRCGYSRRNRCSRPWRRKRRAFVLGAPRKEQPRSQRPVILYRRPDRLRALTSRRRTPLASASRARTGTRLVPPEPIDCFVPDRGRNRGR